MNMDYDIICKLINAFPSDSDYEALLQSQGTDELDDWDIPEAYFL